MYAVKKCIYFDIVDITKNVKEDGFTLVVLYSVSKKKYFVMFFHFYQEM